MVSTTNTGWAKNVTKCALTWALGSIFSKSIKSGSSRHCGFEKLVKPDQQSCKPGQQCCFKSNLGIVWLRLFFYWPNLNFFGRNQFWIQWPNPKLNLWSQWFAFETESELNNNKTIRHFKIIAVLSNHFNCWTNIFYTANLW